MAYGCYYSSARDHSVTSVMYSYLSRCCRVLLSCCPTVVASHSPLKWQSGMAGLPLPFPDYFRGEGVTWWCLACVAATAAGQLWPFIGSKKRGR
jgi:hypothetical protein